MKTTLYSIQIISAFMGGDPGRGQGGGTHPPNIWDGPTLKPLNNYYWLCAFSSAPPPPPRGAPKGGGLGGLSPPPPRGSPKKRDTKKKGKKERERGGRRKVANVFFQPFSSYATGIFFFFLPKLFYYDVS